MSELSQKHCQACEGGVDPLDRKQAQLMMQQLKGWELSENGKEISQTF